MRQLQRERQRKALTNVLVSPRHDETHTRPGSGYAEHCGYASNRLGVCMSHLFLAMDIFHRRYSAHEIPLLKASGSIVASSIVSCSFRLRARIGREGARMEKKEKRENESAEGYGARGRWKARRDAAVQRRGSRSGALMCLPASTTVRNFAWLRRPRLLFFNPPPAHRAICIPYTSPSSLYIHSRLPRIHIRLYFITRPFPFAYTAASLFWVPIFFQPFSASDLSVCSIFSCNSIVGRCSWGGL